MFDFMSDPEVRRQALEMAAWLATGAAGAFGIWERRRRLIIQSQAEANDHHIEGRKIDLDENKFLKELLLDLRAELEKTEQEKAAAFAKLHELETHNMQLRARIEALLSAMEKVTNEQN